MNYSLLVKDVGRVLVCAGVVGTWLYCEVIHDVCAEALRPYALSVLAGWLGLEGVYKLVDGLKSGKYGKNGE